jgi:hypothetical protein
MSSLYRPQGPTTFGSGPSYVEAQGSWIVDAIATIDREGPKSISPTREAEQEWKRKVVELNEQTLFPKVDNWYMGAKILGKTMEPLDCFDGMPLYEKECLDLSCLWEKGAADRRKDYIGMLGGRLVELIHNSLSPSLIVGGGRFSR